MYGRHNSGDGCGTDPIASGDLKSMSIDRGESDVFSQGWAVASMGWISSECQLNYRVNRNPTSNLSPITKGVEGR